MSKKPIELDAYIVTFLLFFAGVVILFLAMGSRFLASPDNIRYPTLAILFGGMAIPLILRMRK